VVEAVTSFHKSTHLGHKSDGATAIGVCEKAFPRNAQSQVDVTLRVFGSPNLHVTARRGPLSTRSAVASLSVAFEPQSLTRSHNTQRCNLLGVLLAFILLLSATRLFVVASVDWL